MRICTANKRKRRIFWRRKGNAHIRFNPGVWLREEVVDPDGTSQGMAQLVLGGGEQPNAYRFYPHGQ